MSIKEALFFMMMPLALCSQSSYKVGFLPKINVGISVGNGYGINLMHQNREQFDQRRINYVLSDFAIFGDKKVDVRNKIALGYLIRIRDGYTFHRMIQQLVINNLSGAKMSHRLRLDETFGGGLEVFRLRYKNSILFPLNGQSVDDKEAYFKSGLEFLNILSENKYSSEMRIVPTLGYNLNNKTKFELSIDHRISQLWESGTKHRMWFGFNFYKKY